MYPVTKFNPCHCITVTHITIQTHSFQISVLCCDCVEISKNRLFIIKAKFPLHVLSPYKTSNFN